MFRAIISPILRSRDCVYSLWYNAPTMLPAGYRPAASSVHYTTSCNTVCAPQDGRNYRPKLVELIGIVNKPLLLHLVGCLYYRISDARSFKHQMYDSPFETFEDRHAHFAQCVSRVDDSDLVGYEVYCFYESRISRLYRWRRSL